MQRWHEGTRSMKPEFIKYGTPLKDGTVHQYGLWWTLFCRYCEERGLQPTQASPETVAGFAQYLDDLGYHPSSIRHAISAIGTAHRNAGHWLDPGHKVIQRVLDGIKKNGKKERPATPLTLDDVRDLRKVLGTPATGGRRRKNEATTRCRNAALVEVALATGLRAEPVMGMVWDESELIRSLRSNHPHAYAKLETWVNRAGIQPSDHIWLPVCNRDVIGPRRLAASELKRITKELMEGVGLLRGMSEKEAKEFGQRYNAESLRSILRPSEPIAACCPLCGQRMSAPKPH